MAPDDGALLVEEEGWLADGKPLVVDGAAPSTQGDVGIWFLVEALAARIAALPSASP